MHARGKLKFAVSFAVAALAVAAPLDRRPDQGRDQVDRPGAARRP